ncbi:hypothetical protein DESAMIL20_1239 [Desulfurella amilsii]|uniref:DUF3783 domain-containing protein n=1 Tax=Desulfurella amilsii TaxID=1562698 RepID=A0A1X4XVW3_9BACT|nr:DUF3783 domain-containing protein [Desulfurella amilsii]OSS41686.1 hypothetical protein DESAMIL20_1239 [Desulfurella amilsii]
MKTIILHDFEQEELIKFVRLYKQLEKDSLLPQAIIAATTSNSLNQILKDLLNELEKEHIEFA